MAFPIVGAAYRPPAKAILSVLTYGTPLTLRPEPDNPFDENAVKVCVSSDVFVDGVANELEHALEGYGLTLDDVRAEPEWHLGYVPRTMAVTLAPQLAGQPAPASLTFDAAGRPMAILTDEGND